MKAFGLGNPSLTKKLSSVSGVDEPSSAHIMAVKVFVASIIKAIITTLSARSIAEPVRTHLALLSYQLFLPLLYLQDLASALVCTDVIRI
jgi:hypothetical protein